MVNSKNLAKTWNKEAKNYKFESDSQVDYLANFYHLSYCFGNPKGKKILEVGSGSGQCSAYLASKGGIIHLLDISEDSLGFSKKYFASKKLAVKLYKQDAFAMTFPSESFDYVWNGGVIEHFSDRKKVEMLKKMWKLVKPGGKILVTVPNANDYPFMLAKRILELRKKWAFGREDDLTMTRIRGLAGRAGIEKFSLYAYNPIVGFWFFPYGHAITNILGLNTLKRHRAQSPFGHVIMFCATKPSKT
jgi:SAM-dependent methyltransferase